MFMCWLMQLPPPHDDPALDLTQAHSLTRPFADSQTQDGQPIR